MAAKTGCTIWNMSYLLSETPSFPPKNFLK